MKYLSAEASKRYNKPPKSPHEAAKILEKTVFDNDLSVREFCFEIHTALTLSDLPLGYYYGAPRPITKTYCYLRFGDRLLPRDRPYAGPLGEPNITYLRCVPDAKPELPKSIHQIGQLCLSPTADAKKAKPSEFIIAVTPTSREIYVIWNPNGPEPGLADHFMDENDEQDYCDHREEIITRPTSGTFPGFPDKRCTAFRLFPTVEHLCQSHNPERQLAASSWRFITLPPKMTLQFPSYPPPPWYRVITGGTKL